MVGGNAWTSDPYVKIQQEYQSEEEAVETAAVNIPSADKQDDKDESIKEGSAAISMRKLSDYAIPEEQVILEKVTVVVSEPSEQEQLEKSIASITASSQEETERAVDSLDDDGPAADEVAGEVGEPQPVDSLDEDPLGSGAGDEAGAAVVAPQPVDSLDDDPLGPGAGEEKIMEFFVSKKCAGFVTG